MQSAVVALIVSSMLFLSGCAGLIAAAHSGAAAIAAQGAGVTLAVGATAGAVVALAAPDVYKTLNPAEDGQGAGQEPGTPKTFGAFLATGQTEVRTLVQRAMQAQREVLVVAGVRAQNAIARGRAEFRDSLPLTSSALGEREKRFQAEIEALVADLYSPVDARVKDAGERAQAIAYRLRSPGAVPLLNASGPIFLFPSIPFQSINVSGNFPASGTAETVAQLSIGGKSYKAFDYATDRLSFSVPTADLNAAEPESIVWRTGIVSVPWSPPSGFFSSTGIEQLRVDIGILPHSFGRMSIDYTTSTATTQQKTVLSGEFLLTAANSEVADRSCLVLAPQELADGWRLRPGSSAFVPGQAGLQNADEWKEWKLGLISETPQEVCWRASATHSGDAAPRQGKAGWKISATLWREVSEPRVNRENVDLAWGSKHYFKYPPGTWKLRYARTGAGVTELAAADATHPLIRVAADASGVTVSIYPF